MRGFSVCYARLFILPERDRNTCQSSKSTKPKRNIAALCPTIGSRRSVMIHCALAATWDSFPQAYDPSMHVRVARA